MTLSNTIAQEYDMATIQGVLGYFGKLAELPGAYNRLQEEFAALKEQLTEVIAQVKGLTAQLGDKSRDLAEAQSELRRTSDWLRASREDNGQLRETIRQRDTTVAAHRDVISKHEADRRELVDTIAGHVTNAAVKDEVIRLQDIEIKALQARIARMVSIANGTDEVPTVDKVLAEQVKEVPADPLSSVETAPASPGVADVGTSGEKATTQSPISTEWDPPKKAESEPFRPYEGYRPFARAAAQDWKEGQSGAAAPSHTTGDPRPDGQVDPDLGRRDAIFG